MVGTSSPVVALQEALRTGIQDLSHQPGPYSAAGIVGRPSVTDLWELFDAQVTSRHLDVVARDLQAAGRGFYTIGSAGHEGNGVLARTLRPSDPALLHYRSGAFYCARAGQVTGSTPVRDILQGLMGAAEEPIAGGRHKVFGRAELNIIPQTSTIASHLPRAVGLAMSAHRARRVGVTPPWPADAVVVCSFGDASVNHSTAVGAINAAVNAAHRGLPVPLLLVCEDNGLGISVPTPRDWIATTYGDRSGLDYVRADGSDPVGALSAISAAVDQVRSATRPLFLHLDTVRFLGHAGSDAEISYRTPSQISAEYVRDPILGTARALVTLGGVAAEDVLARHDLVCSEVEKEAAALEGAPTLQTGAQIMAPLSPRSPDQVAAAAAELAPTAEVSPEATSAGTPHPAHPGTLAENINQALSTALSHDPRVLVFGEDVGRKGGVYGVTRGLQRTYGAARVFDTILDEQSILGLGLGAGLNGLLPVPEIQYLAYLHNAEDQLRGEAASLSFFSNAQYRNPMVVRVAGLAYQRGFGGHFHNDNGLGVLRDIPGLVVAVPAHPGDAAPLLRTCLAAAATDGTVSVLLEPIALYHQRDLYADGDDGWLGADSGEHVPIGTARVHGSGADVTIITFGNGVRMSLRVAQRLAAQGVGAQVVDLRWLSPLPVEDILRAADRTGRVVVADETRHSGGVGEGVLTALVEAGYTGRMTRVSSADTFIPLGTAASAVLLSEDDIERATLALAHT